ncbi:hypothetical protein MUP77_19175 [Candidatus Bathyarchaeota archaeon]|nr:hypothetical protein [Candidatus Bathyarchaeota archaeon]
MEKRKNIVFNKTIKISSEVHSRLMDWAKKSETLDQAISRLLDIAEGRKG